MEYKDVINKKVGDKIGNDLVHEITDYEDRFGNQCRRVDVAKPGQKYAYACYNIGINASGEFCVWHHF